MRHSERCGDIHSWLQTGQLWK